MGCLVADEQATPDAGACPGLLVTVTKPPLDVGEPADCCCATAKVRVVLPPAAGHASRSELHLCAHHYRKAAAGLTRAGADVYDAQGQWLPGHERYWTGIGSESSSDVRQPA